MPFQVLEPQPPSTPRPEPVHTTVSLIVDDTVVTEEPSTVAISETKMVELGLFDGDVVRIGGKRKKWTLAVAVADKNVPTNNIRLSKMHKSNLRYEMQ